MTVPANNINLQYENRTHNNSMYLHNWTVIKLKRIIITLSSNDFRMRSCLSASSSLQRSSIATFALSTQAGVPDIYITTNILQFIVQQPTKFVALFHNCNDRS